MRSPYLGQVFNRHCSFSDPAHKCVSNVLIWIIIENSYDSLMLTIEKIVFLKANGATSCFVAECENWTHSTHSQFHWSHSIYTTTGHTQHTHTATDQIQPTLPLVILNTDCHCLNSAHLHYHWSVWLNGWAFVYELSGCGFESHSSQLNFRYHASFE